MPPRRRTLMRWTHSKVRALVCVHVVAHMQATWRGRSAMSFYCCMLLAVAHVLKRCIHSLWQPHILDRCLYSRQAPHLRHEHFFLVAAQARCWRQAIRQCTPRRQLLPQSSQSSHDILCLRRGGACGRRSGSARRGCAAAGLGGAPLTASAAATRLLPLRHRMASRRWVITACLFDCQLLSQSCQPGRSTTDGSRRFHPQPCPLLQKERLLMVSPRHWCRPVRSEAGLVECIGCFRYLKCDFFAPLYAPIQCHAACLLLQDRRIVVQWGWTWLQAEQRGGLRRSRHSLDAC